MPAAPAAPPPAPTKHSPAPAPQKVPDKPTIDAPVGHEPPPQNYLADDMAEFTEMDQADEASKRGEAPKRDEKGKFVKPQEAPQKPQDKPEPEKAVEAPPEPEKPVEEPKPGTMRALGKAYDEKIKLINHELQPKIQSLSSENEQLKQRLEQLSKSQPDPKPLQDKLAAIEKENQQLREAIGFADYRESPDFREKYQAPYEEAWSEAMQELSEIQVTTADGGTRKFTANDLLSLANAPVDKSDEIIEQSFPRLTTQQRVIGHVNEIRKLAKAQEKALETAKKNAGAFKTNQTKATEESNKAFFNAYQGANTEISTKFPKFFGLDETDPKGNEMLKNGFSYVDSVFSPQAEQLPPEKKAGRLAVIRAKAANHDREVYRRKNAEARVAELEKSLAEFEKSEPTTETAGDPASGGSPLDWMAQDEAELRKLDT